MKNILGWQLAGLAVINLLVIISMQVIGRDLAPYNIVQFEFAGSVSLAQTMVKVWSEQGVLGKVFFLIGFDYLFMLTYSTFLWLGCKAVAIQWAGSLRTWLMVVAGSQWAAAGLDAIENVALYQMASASTAPIWPTLSWYCALPKFLMVLAGLMVCLFGVARWLIQKVNR